MANLSGFNAEEWEDTSSESGGFEPLPPGDYTMLAIDSEMKETRKGGERLNFQWEIIEGEHKGRYIWDGFNLKNASEKAVKISKSELASLCRACGVMSPDDSAQLHNIPITARVKIGKWIDGEGNEQTTNNVGKFRPATATAATASAAVTADNGQQRAPWAR
jgi:hypothetical protein